MSNHSVSRPAGEAPRGLIEDERSVTEVVLAAMRATPDPRLREVMEALVRHLHAFAREVRLTEEELELGIGFLNRIGQATHAAHNEGVPLSDAVGLYENQDSGGPT